MTSPTRNQYHPYSYGGSSDGGRSIGNCGRCHVYLPQIINHTDLKCRLKDKTVRQPISNKKISKMLNYNTAEVHFE